MNKKSHWRIIRKITGPALFIKEVQTKRERREQPQKTTSPSSMGKGIKTVVNFGVSIAGGS